jgi:hypothetical protein
MEDMVDRVIDELPGSVTLPSSAIPPDAEPQAEPQTGETEPEVATTAPEQVAPSPVVKIPAPPPPKKKERQPITLAEAPQHIGEYMTVVNRRGIRREGVLVSIGPDKLKFQREILGAGGYMEFAIEREDIAGLELQ